MVKVNQLDIFSFKIKFKDLECRGIENCFMPTNINDINTRLEIILEIELSGHTDTLKEANSLID